MRFNKQELIALASQASQNFDREGVMVMKERQEGFFRRSEGCSVRWFRLRGNLLFYLRGPEPWNEPIGVIVLGNHEVKVQDQDENGHWPFHIVWENGVSYRMAAFHETERGLWLNAVERAPYESIRMRMSSLRRRLVKSYPVMPLPTYRQLKGTPIDENEVPIFELAVSCDNLLCDDLGHPPSPVVVATVKLSTGSHVTYGKTETIEGSSNPCFSKTILFWPRDGLVGEDQVKLTVYDVREPVSDTMAYMGSTSLLLNTIQEALGLRVPVIGEAGKTVGFITMNSWILEPSYVDMMGFETQQKIYSHRRSQSLPPRLGLKFMYPCFGTLFTQNYVNPYQATYRFHSGLGGDINVYEIMAEVKICYEMPMQVVDMFTKREREHLEELLSISEVCAPWQARQIQLMGIHTSLLKHYVHSKQRMENIDTPYFKPSNKKHLSSLEFVPTNLHLQRMWVHNDTINKTGFHDVITVGAFTARTQTSERNEGLLQLLQQMKDVNSTRMPLLYASAHKINSDYDNITAMRHFRDEIIRDMYQTVSLAAGRRSEEIANCIDEIKNKLNNFINLYDPNLIEEALSYTNVPNNEEETETISSIMSYAERLGIFDENSSNNTDSSSKSFSDEMSNNGNPVPMSTSASAPNINPQENEAAAAAVAGASGLQLKQDHFRDAKWLSQPICSGNSGQLPEAPCASLASSASRSKSGSIRYDQSVASMENETFIILLDNFAAKKSAENYEFTSVEQLTQLGVATRKLNLSLLKNFATTAKESLSAYYAAVRKALHTNLDDVKKDFDNLENCVRAAQQAIERLIIWMRVAHVVLRLRCEPYQFTFDHAAMQTRRDACFSQALTTVSAGLVCWLNSKPMHVVVKILSAGLGPLCSFEGLLTLYATEKAMWGDMVVAVEDLHSVVFVLTKASHKNTTPKATGARGSITVLIPVSEALFIQFASRQQKTFCVTAVFFNIGINEKVDLAEEMGDTAPQFQSNCDNLNRLSTYYHQYKNVLTDRTTNQRDAASPRSKSLEEVMESLHVTINKKIQKNVEVLHLAALATRLMNGVRFTSCKSAKDRTAMSVTLEQTSILSAEYQLAEHERQKALDIMRSDGCRRENTEKNIKCRKYAFSRKQVLALPEEYRPPAGSYGATQT